MKRMLLAAMMAALAAIGADGAEIVLRLAENQPENNPVTHADFRLAELVKEATGGKLLIEVYPGAILGQETESIQQTRAGVIELSRVNTVPLAEFVKELGVVTLPYVFASPEHQKRVVAGSIGAEIAAAFEKAGLKLICWFHAGSRHFYTSRKPIKGVADVKGMKLRVQPAQISIKMVELMGGSPTPMNYSEVYSALQTGVIDGAENDYVSYYTSSHYEVAKYITEDGHLSPPAVIIMNKDKFDSLSPDYQKILLDAGRQAMDFEFKAMMDFEDESKDLVVKAGTQVFAVDVTEFQKAVAPIYAEYPEFDSILKKIQALQ
ncbi:MAG: TRAP transporter substrate-binding protein [Planctomycetota bacterium]|nr:TRAP transporter substrate-binding protein [Planctomycetota bacterium]